MSSIVLASGVVRASRPLFFGAKHERAGEVFGLEVALMTQVGDVLGETLKVVVFEPRDGTPSWDPQPGENVSVIVEVDSGRFGLSGTYKRHATAADVKALPMGTPTFDLADAKG
jgi:hypothetical protein